MAICENCSNFSGLINPLTLYTVRTCKVCGREYAVQEPGEEGFGIKIREGERVVLAKEALKISPNPLKGSGQFSRYGVSWFATLVFGSDLLNADQLRTPQFRLEELQEKTEAAFTNADFLSDIDWADEDSVQEGVKRLKDKQGGHEFWAFLSACEYFEAQKAQKSKNTEMAIQRTALAERLRSLSLFLEHFSEPVSMAQSVRRLLDLLLIWENNKSNSSEKFWQKTFEVHSYAFSQLFSSPITFVESNAYVGGTRVDKSGARLLDFLFAEAQTDSAILVEIKTPTSKLLGNRYRANVYQIGKDVTGGIVQVNDYLDQLRSELAANRGFSPQNLSVFNPRRIVLVGNRQDIQGDPSKMASFDNFRQSLSGVEIVTFDEMFLKIEQLVNLFGLKRDNQDQQSS